MTVNNKALFDDPTEAQAIRVMQPRLPEHWAMYQKLGGTRGADEYANMAAMFFRMTSSAYIFGCASAYGDDRAECMASYRQWVDTHYNGEDVVKIFASIDMVSSYS